MKEPFMKWAEEMGYYSKEDNIEDRQEMERDLKKVAEVAPKFYNFLSNDIAGGV